MPQKDVVLLLEAGYRYAFISNADNLGADLDETILGYFVANGCPFLMEMFQCME